MWSELKPWQKLVVAILMATPSLCALFAIAILKSSVLIIAGLIVVLFEIAALLVLHDRAATRGLRLTPIPPREERDRERTNASLSSWFSVRKRVADATRPPLRPVQ